jgi:hypothetical protein
VVEVIVPLPPGDAQIILPVKTSAVGFGVVVILTILLVEEQGAASVAIT